MVSGIFTQLWLLFNTYVKLLGEIICHQYVVHTQLYNSILGCLSNAIKVLSECIMAIWTWMQKNRFQSTQQG